MSAAPRPAPGTRAGADRACSVRIERARTLLLTRRLAVDLARTSSATCRRAVDCC